MVIFHSYVSLPEGISIYPGHLQNVLFESLFFLGSFGSSTSGAGTYPYVAYVTDFWSMGFMFLGDSLSWSQRGVVAKISLDSFRMLQICGCV